LLPSGFPTRCIVSPVRGCAFGNNLHHVRCSSVKKLDHDHQPTPDPTVLFTHLSV